MTPGQDAMVEGQRARVLIVDDDTFVATFLSRVLSSEYAVTVANGGREALAKIDAGERYALILCDLMMPDLDGMGVHQRITALDAEQADRIVFLTGGVFVDHLQDFLDTVPNVRLRKPLEVADVRAAVRATIRAMTDPLLAP